MKLNTPESAPESAPEAGNAAKSSGKIRIVLDFDEAAKRLQIGCDIGPVEAFPILCHALDATLAQALAWVLTLPPEKRHAALENLAGTIQRNIPSMHTLAQIMLAGALEKLK
jgi:hypothetical protein